MIKMDFKEITVTANRNGTKYTYKRKITKKMRAASKVNMEKARLKMLQLRRQARKNMMKLDGISEAEMKRRLRKYYSKEQLAEMVSKSLIKNK